MSLPKQLLEAKICNKDTCEIKRKLDQKAKDKMKQLQEEKEKYKHKFWEEQEQNEYLQDRMKELETINEEHRKLNGELREENERLREENKHIFANVNDDQLLRSNAMNYAELQDYKARNEKAIEYINISLRDSYENDKYPLNGEDFEHLLNILQGKSDE